MSRLAALVLYAFFLLSTHAVADDTTLKVSDLRSGSVVLSRYFTVLEDAGATLSLADVQQQGVATQFKTRQMATSDLNLGYSRSAFWLRLRLENAGHTLANKVLEIDYALLSRVEFHQILEDGRAQSLATGNALPFSTRAYPNRGFVFPVAIAPHSTTTLYLRIQGVGALVVPAKLWEKSAFQDHEKSDYIGHAWYYGMVTAMVLFNLLLFVALGDLIYLLYVAFVTATSLGLASRNGLASEFLWPNATTWPQLSTTFFYSIAICLLLLFMRQMLNTATVTPSLDRLIKLTLGLLLLGVAGMFIDIESVIKPNTFLYLIAIALIATVGTTCAIKRQRSAYFFLAAFTTLVVGSLLGALRALGVLPTNVFTINGMQVGSSVEMILLAFALADRFNMIRREKAKAQKETYAAQQQLVENLKSSERLLEERVARRTAQLQASHTTLAATLDDLQASQTQLIQSEKMASLGQLIANVANEISAPIAVVQSGGRDIADTLDPVLECLPHLFQILEPLERHLFNQLIGPARQPAQASDEERVLASEITQRLEAAGIVDARQKADILLQLNAHSFIDDCLPLLRHGNAEFILNAALHITTIICNTHHITSAVDRVSRIVTALKSFSQTGGAGEMGELDLRDNAVAQ